MDTRDKVGLITGATQGLGRAAAAAIAKSGMQLVLVARNASRGAAVVDEIKRESGNERIDLMVADLSEQAEVRRLAAEFLQRHSRLHLLVNNAGAVFETRQVTADGLERTFALNHMAYFLLTQSLLPVLRQSAPARVVNVASAAHKAGTLDFADLQSSQHYSGMRAYSRSKMANILFTAEQARRLQGTGVTVNCLHPGVVSTGFALNNRGWVRHFYKLFGFMMRSPEQGAATIVHLALAPEVESVTGGYFSDSKPIKPAAFARQPFAQQQLWAQTEAVLTPATA